MPFTRPSKNPKKLFNLRFAKRELWHQSCISENFLDESSIRRKRIGPNKKTLMKKKKGEFIIWLAINQRENIGTIADIIWKKALQFSLFWNDFIKNYFFLFWSYFLVPFNENKKFKNNIDYSLRRAILLFNH